MPTAINPDDYVPDAFGIFIDKHGVPLDPRGYYNDGQHSLCVYYAPEVGTDVFVCNTGFRELHVIDHPELGCDDGLSFDFWSEGFYMVMSNSYYYSVDRCF